MCLSIREHPILQEADAHFSLDLNTFAVFQPTVVFILFDIQIVPYVVSKGTFKLDPIPFYPILCTLIAALLPGTTVYSQFLLPYSVWWKTVVKDQTGTPAVLIITGLFLHLFVERARHFFFF